MGKEERRYRHLHRVARENDNDTSDEESSGYRRPKYDSTSPRELLTAYEKQGHIFCCCCDTRRGTIIISLINTLISIAVCILVRLIAQKRYSIDWLFQYMFFDEDGDFQNDFHLALAEYVWVIYFFFGICCFFNLISLLGAIFYKAWWVLMGALWSITIGIATLIAFGWGGIGVFVACFMAYPNFMFFQERQEGIMTEKNYENEMYSCCCLKSFRRKVTIQDAIESRVGVFS